VRALRASITAAGLVLAWQAVVSLSGVPPYILPGPFGVAAAWLAQVDLILRHAVVTFAEIGLGLVAGTLLGALSAVSMSYFRPARRWLLPPKVMMATLIIYFPVTASLFDGLRRTEPGWLDLARTMTVGTGRGGSGRGGSGRVRWATLRHIRIPAALPAFASGLRVAAAVAPIGAVVGEWVGSSAGLGYLMLHANARMQVDLMFAALLTLALFAVLLYFGLDGLLRRLLPWQPETLPEEDPVTPLEINPQ
jgi:putative hydroxymethylpyrimidine transport system permease protein